MDVLSIPATFNSMTTALDAYSTTSTTTNAAMNVTNTTENNNFTTTSIPDANATVSEISMSPNDTTTYIRSTASSLAMNNSVSEITQLLQTHTTASPGTSRSISAQASGNGGREQEIAGYRVAVGVLAGALFLALIINIILLMRYR